MNDWFRSINAQRHLSGAAVKALLDEGFVVMPGAVSAGYLASLAQSYDEAIRSADASDVSVGASTTRVSDFVNRSRVFDTLYLHPPLLDACCRVIGQPFKLSTMVARTLRPHTIAQKLHVDFASDVQGFPMLGFIYMIDEFRPENGATCFIPGSQGALSAPEGVKLVPASAPAGSLILFNGSMWHGHGANHTDRSRRSVQGAYIRRTEKSGGDLLARMLPQTLRRIGPLAKYLLDVKHQDG